MNGETGTLKGEPVRIEVTGEDTVRLHSVRCPFGDVTCPCQDGDPCHYVEADGFPAMAPPVQMSARFPTQAEADKLVDKACNATSMLLEVSRILTSLGMDSDSGLPISDALRVAYRGVNALTEQAYLLAEATQKREEKQAKDGGNLERILDDLAETHP